MRCFVRFSVSWVMVDVIQMKFEVRDLLRLQLLCRPINAFCSHTPLIVCGREKPCTNKGIIYGLNHLYNLNNCRCVKTSQNCLLICSSPTVHFNHSFDSNSLKWLQGREVSNGVINLIAYLQFYRRNLLAHNSQHQSSQRGRQWI